MVPRLPPLVALALLLPVILVQGPAHAASGDCGTNRDQQGDPWPIAMSPATRGVCEGGFQSTVSEPVLDTDRYTWPLHRDWDLRVEVVAPPGVEMRIRRILLPEHHVWAEVTGSGTVVSEADLPSWPSSKDHAILEIVQIDSLDAADVGAAYTLTVTRLPNDAGDCGGADAPSTGAPKLVPIGVACPGNFVDGWVEDPTYADRLDRFAVPVTRGDILSVALTVGGHSYAFSVSGGGISSTQTLRPAIGQTTSTSGTWQATSDGSVTLTLQPSYPDVVQVWHEPECGELGCWPGYWETVDVYDSRSNGPFDYTLRVDLQPNSPPSFDVLGVPPGPLFGGASFDFDVRVMDPDGNEVRPLVGMGSTSNLLPVSPPTGPSGTSWRFHTGPLTADANLYVDAVDSFGVEALPGSGLPSGWQRHVVKVYPADCGETDGDAPPTGRRMYDGRCDGWVGAGIDDEDVLLLDLPAGSHRVVLQNVHWENAPLEVTKADGTPFTVVGNEHRAAVEGPTTVRIRVTPRDAYTPYSVVARVTPAPPSDGTASVHDLASFVQSHGPLRPAGELDANGATAHYKKRFDVPAWALAQATGARLWVLGRTASPPCRATLALMNGQTIASTTSCAAWTTDPTPAWTAFELSPGLLVAGENEATLRANNSFGLGARLAYDDAGNVSRSTNASGHAFAWALELDLADPSLAPPAEGLARVFLLRSNDPQGEDARVTVDWGDGTAPTAWRARWDAPTRVLHAPAASGARTLVASGETLSSGRPLTATTTALQVGHPGDCREYRDAPAFGARFVGACRGALGPGDPDDLLLFEASFGQRVRVLGTGAAHFALTAPDGTDAPFVDGVASHYATRDGTYRLRITNPTPPDRVDYHVVVENASKPVPTGAATLSGPRFVPVGEATNFTVVAMDLDYADVAIDLAWGDGNVSRLPASGYLPSETTPRVASHRFDTPGPVELRASGASVTGRPLTGTTLAVAVVAPDDCGAGEAPNAVWPTTPFLQVPGVLLTTYPTLGHGPCYGALHATDPRDVYRVTVPVGKTFEVRVAPGQGLALAADVWFSGGSVAYGLYGGNIGVTRTTQSDGTVVLRPQQGAAHNGEFLLEVKRTSGAGAYEIRVIV